MKIYSGGRQRCSWVLYSKGSFQRREEEAWKEVVLTHGVALGRHSVRRGMACQGTDKWLKGQDLMYVDVCLKQVVSGLE